ncbi:22859_t:CDS:2 [Gigaspora margarita]|uniref:22859_t:CDS:1 n=1 Tax=Gigaspora margarita TaxID=4874 RepID=A0ABM8VWR0_GIGMA|nr:22859_t:CDS:2 [Gigaspora margarita]
MKIEPELLVHRKENFLMSSGKVIVVVIKLQKLASINKPEYPEDYKINWTAFNKVLPQELVRIDNHHNKSLHYHCNGQLKLVEPNIIRSNSIKALLHGLTEERLELFSVLAKKQPNSLLELANYLHRDYQELAVLEKPINMITILFVKSEEVLQLIQQALLNENKQELPEIEFTYLELGKDLYHSLCSMVKEGFLTLKKLKSLSSNHQEVDSGAYTALFDIRRHYFTNGNKRTALLVMLAFIQACGFTLKDDKDNETFLLK